jgi:hypothetical protein
MNINTEDARAFFFEFMQNGYAGMQEPENILCFPEDRGTKRHSYGNLSLWYGIDEWQSSNQSNGSSGTTRLYYKKSLVWVMHYMGSYRDDSITCLKHALGRAYGQGLWLGGRGPEVCEHGKWIYQNNCIENEFARFSGRETIANRELAKVVGEHRYFGGLLIQ